MGLPWITPWSYLCPLLSITSGKNQTQDVAQRRSRRGARGRVLTMAGDEENGDLPNNKL